MINPQICKIRRIAEKAAQNYVKLRFPALPKAEKNATKKFDDIMIAFSRHDDLAKFEQEFDSAIKDLK